MKFVLPLFLLFVPVSAFACQMVCNHSKEGSDLILCDPKEGFETILWFKAEDGKPTSLNLSEKMKCHIDDEDGRITLCALDEHRFKSRIVRHLVEEISPNTGKTVRTPSDVLEVKIESPLVESLPSTVVRTGPTTLNLTFSLEDCAAKSRSDRLKGRR